MTVRWMASMLQFIIFIDKMSSLYRSSSPVRALE